MKLNEVEVLNAFLSHIKFCPLVFIPLRNLHPYKGTHKVKCWKQVIATCSANTIIIIILYNIY